MASHGHRVCPSTLLPTAPTPHVLVDLHLFAVLTFDHLADEAPTAVTSVGPLLSEIGGTPGSALGALSCGSSYRSSLWRSSTMFFVSTTSSFTSSILDANSPDQYSSSSRSGLSSSASWISLICSRASWICCTNSSIGWGLWVDIYTSLSCVPLGVQVLASFTKRV